MPVNTRLFEAKEDPLQLYNGKAVIDLAFRFFTVLDCADVPYEEFDFDFPDYEYSYFRAYNERLGRLEKDLSMSMSEPYLLLNASVSDMTFEDNGNYYYEIGYSRGGYEQALRYGTLNVI
jgi:hypothetical protein